MALPKRCLAQFTTLARHTSKRHALPSSVKIVEVGPRDGLQNEPKALTAQTKIELVNRLSAAGLSFIEAGSFVGKGVPAMQGSADVIAGAARRDGLRLSALTPNMKGFEAAAETKGLDEVAVFGAASDAFSLKNINCNVLDSLQRFRPVVAAAKARGIPVRGYVSCVVGCPYSGPVAPPAVAHVARALLDMGCHEISLGDTIGVGTPLSIQRMLHSVIHDGGLDASQLAIHAHDTYGQGLVNVMAALECGVAVVDASVAGLGGCPYAGGGASGNVATEDVVYMLHGLGIHTGVDLDKLSDAATYICGELGTTSRSRAGTARASRKAALAKAHTEGKETKHIQIALEWPEVPMDEADAASEAVLQRMPNLIAAPAKASTAPSPAQPASVQHSGASVDGAAASSASPPAPAEAGVAQPGSSSNSGSSSSSSMDSVESNNQSRSKYATMDNT